MKEIIQILIFFLFVLSCQSTPDKDRNKITTFNLKKLPKVTSVKLSNLGFADIEYIPLETNKQSLIQRKINLSSLKDRLIVGSNYIIIKQFNTILKFSNDGSFITKIGKEGRGPIEFQSCHDLDINVDGQIFIMDGWKKKFFVYSENGEFIKTINIPIYGLGDFRVVDDKLLCYSENHLGNIENSFNLIDTGGKIIKSFSNKYPFIKYKNDAYGFYHEDLFYSFNNKLFKKEVYSDTIYSYENMNFSPHLVIEVGDRLITPEARSMFAGLDLAKNYISPSNLFEFGNYVYYEFTYKFDFSNSMSFGFIGSKNSDFQALINPEEGIINDLDGGPNILPLTIKDNNTIIGWVEALQLKAHVTSEVFKNSTPKYPEKKKELEKLADGLKETDNPILMMVRLKK